MRAIRKIRESISVRMPFEKLMELVGELKDLEEPMALTFGDLHTRWGEPPERIMDAVTAVRVMRGERTYIS